MIDILRSEQYGGQFVDNIIYFIFLSDENFKISNKIPLKFVHNSPIDNTSVLV